MQGMLGKLPLSEIQGPRDDFEQRLAGPDGPVWLEEFKKYLRKEKTWTFSIFKHITAVSVPGVAKFVVADHFKVDNTDGVRIVWLNDNFKKVFLSKTEKNIEGCDLNVYDLTKASLDVPILAELGDRAEIALAHLWVLLKRQPNGGLGSLLTNGFANIFYVRDDNGILWAVYADWLGVSWGLSVYSVGNPRGWDAGRRVFSR